MLIKELFQSDVTRDIPPVVYFHEQTPAKLQDEVSEYIITGGYPDTHPNKKRVPNGIHEQYVRLLQAIVAELGKPGGPELPTAWISGFYGSGKSSFAKLLGLALDGVELPGGISLAEAWLRRDTSERRSELRAAWDALRVQIDPIAVVFDVGSVARSHDHLHTTALRELQTRLGYCSADPLVADFELKLERRGEWDRFLAIAEETLGKQWAEVKDRPLAEDEFSLVMSVMSPELYTDPMSWYTSRGGTHKRVESPEDAVIAIGDMLKYRRPEATLFFVVDEVSQYVLANKDRVDRMRAFATALGARLKGKAWLLALGQQKLDEEADDSFLLWARDRFPPKLRVHLEATNIRDVVHKRLLHKKPEHEKTLADLFETRRSTLELYAYGCRDVSPEEFAEVYPMLPGHIDLLLQITSALRTRSARAQGDDQAIRGLLQLLGELFRTQKLADMDVGRLVTLDQIYDVQHTALDSDTQDSMARILSHCAEDDDDLRLRAAKAVALLELLQETDVATTPELVAQCLYDHVDRGNQLSEVRDALDSLRRANLLGYTEKLGYKIQSSAGEEWDRERRNMPAGPESRSEVIKECLEFLAGRPDRPRYQGRPFPWTSRYSDSYRTRDATLVGSRDPAAVCVDFQFLGTRDARAPHDDDVWIKKSAESNYCQRLIWVVGDTVQLEDQVRELVKARAMVKKYEPRRESLSGPRKLLLQQEQNNVEDLTTRARIAVESAFMAGTMYFAGRALRPRDHGAAFTTALEDTGTRILPELFPHFDPTIVQPSELMVLVERELSAPSPKFMDDKLGILELDGGRYEPVCSGPVPTRIFDTIKSDAGLSGALLLSHFGAPPYGYTDNVIKACVVGLLRARRVEIQPDGAGPITDVRDAGVREVFGKDRDRAFKRAMIVPAGEDDIGVRARNRICRFFADQLDYKFDREDHAIADAVALHFPKQGARLRALFGRLAKLPDRREPAKALVKLDDALATCVERCRETRITVQRVKKHINALSDGFKKLNQFDAELTDAAIDAVRAAADVRDHQVAQLRATGTLDAEGEAAATRIEEQLARERPWNDIAALDADIAHLRAAYIAERTRRLSWQEQEVSKHRDALKRRPGFSTLTGKQSNAVLRPLAQAETNTTADAMHPTLAALHDPFLIALAHAAEQANELLDDIRSQGDELIEAIDVRLQLGLRNRELASEEDVAALIRELEERLLAKVRAGVRVRLK